MELLHSQALQLTAHRHGVLGEGAVSKGEGRTLPYPQVRPGLALALALHNVLCSFVPGE